MNKPDLIITQTKHVDYPLFRQTLERNRNFFGKVIIYFSEHNRFPYFDHFIQSALSHLDCQFLDPVKIDWGREDWRNVSTNELLKHSDSEWICSVEQDWFAKDWDKLLKAVEKAMQTADYVGWWQESNNYIHPAFWYIKREVLEQTSKDFSARQPHDHFGWISEDVKKLGGKIKTLQDLGFNCNVEPEADAFHLGGVNQNVLEGLRQDYTFHRPDIFAVYNYYSQKIDVLQSPKFVKLMKKIGNKLPLLSEDIERWKEFFR